MPLKIWTRGVWLVNTVFEGTLFFCETRPPQISDSSCQILSLPPQHLALDSLQWQFLKGQRKQPKVERLAMLKDFNNTSPALNIIVALPLMPLQLSKCHICTGLLFKAQWGILSSLLQAAIMPPLHYCSYPQKFCAAPNLKVLLQRKLR